MNRDKSIWVCQSQHEAWMPLVLVAFVLGLLGLIPFNCNPVEAQMPECDLPIPIDLGIRHRGSLEICYYEFRVVYWFSPSYRQLISYYAPKYPKPILHVRGNQPNPTVRVWIIPPHNSYQFDVFVRVVGKHYNSAWSDPVTMISDGGE